MYILKLYENWEKLFVDVDFNEEELEFGEWYLVVCVVYYIFINVDM